MARTIRCAEARRTLDFDVHQSCDFVARAQTEKTDHLQTVERRDEV
jgi:hypothetical protein